jgi:hypothetical protein
MFSPTTRRVQEVNEELPARLLCSGSDHPGSRMSLPRLLRAAKSMMIVY